MGFSAPQAARLAGCSPSQLDYWDRCGLIVARPSDPDGAYSFRDLVALRMVRSLLDDPTKAEAIGREAKERVRHRFLGTRTLVQAIELYELYMRRQTQRAPGSSY